MTTHNADDFRAKSYDVLVSYQRADDAARDILIEALQAAKLSVWWDSKLVSGAWRPQLADRINNCGCVVALWSALAEAAPDEVGDEMAQARGLKPPHRPEDRQCENSKPVRRAELYGLRRLDGP